MLDKSLLLSRMDTAQALQCETRDDTYAWLIIHTAGLSILGWLVFLLNDRRAMRRGTLR